MFAEWPRGVELALWQRAPEAQVFLQPLPPMEREEQLRHLAALAFYTQGGALPVVPPQPDRELVSYEDLF